MSASQSRCQEVRRIGRGGEAHGRNVGQDRLRCMWCVACLLSGHLTPSSFSSGAAGNFLAPISALSSNAFRTVLEIDTLGTYNAIKSTLPYVRQAKGAYIHLSATLHYRATPYQAHVSAAKAGVDALSKVLAVEEGPSGVRSNVIAPGPIGGTEGNLVSLFLSINPRD